MIDGVKLIKLPQHSDYRGGMVVIEGLKDIPFEIKRLFYIYGVTSEAVRGMHANRSSEFVLISISGSSKVKVIDQFGKEDIYCLDSPSEGLYLPKMIWKEMYDFSDDSILMVLSNAYYDPTEYIIDFDEYTIKS